MSVNGWKIQVELIRQSANKQFRNKTIEEIKNEKNKYHTHTQYITLT